MVRVFANGPGDWGSIQGRVIPKTQKWYLIPPCLTFSIIRYGSWVKWSNPEKGVAHSSTPQCSSYWKGSLRLWLPTLFALYIYIYIYICTFYKRACSSLPCYIKKKGNTEMRTRILMSSKKFNDSQKDKPLCCEFVHGRKQLQMIEPELNI